MHVCGLDFGTSNSAVGVIREGRARLAPLGDDADLLPSAVFFDAEEPERILFGRAAIDASVSGLDGRLMRALKSVLGSSLIDEETVIGRRRVAFSAVIETFIREMKTRAEGFLGEELTVAIHGRPVHFVDGDAPADARAQSVLEDIARRAGFREVVFAFEPIAAAMQYEAGATGEELVLVADIGGGTSDFALVRIGPQRLARLDRREDILASAGVRLGGTDFDTALSLAAVMPLLGLGSHLVRKRLPMPRALYHDLATWARINFSYTYKTERMVRELLADAAEPEKLLRLQKVIEQRLGHRVAHSVEQGKIALSEVDATDIALAFVEDRLTSPARSDQFGRAIGGLMGRLTDTAARCIADAGVAPEAVKTVFFTGGSSHVPMVRAAVMNATPSATATEGSDFVSVAMGLTRLAALHGGVALAGEQ